MISDGTGATSYVGTAKRSPKGEMGLYPSTDMGDEKCGEESSRKKTRYTETQIA